MIRLFAASCGLLALAYPDWRTEVRAHDCPEGDHRDEFGYCVGPGADTPPSDEYLEEGQAWEYRGNGTWVATCVEPVGVCKGKSYEGKSEGGVISVEIISVDTVTDSSGINAPLPPVNLPVEPQPSPEPPVEPPPARSCATSAFEQQIDLLDELFDPSEGRPCEYYVYMRRFAEPESFGGGFSGDNRRAGASLDATSRTSGSFILETDGRGTVLNVCSDPTHHVTGLTGTAHPTATLVNGISEENGKPFITFTTAGSNPVVPGSPDIDSRLDLQAEEDSRSITLSGTLSGDPFPSGEVFIVDSRGNSVLLTSFMSPFDATTGPFIYLPGSGDSTLASFQVNVPKGEGGVCG
jgi:hypothetical protein